MAGVLTTRTKRTIGASGQGCAVLWQPICSKLLTTLYFVEMLMNKPIPKPFETAPIDQNRQAPKTDLGRRLLALRERAIAKGMRLLSQEEILAEIRQRRGEDD